MGIRFTHKRLQYRAPHEPGSASRSVNPSRTGAARWTVRNCRIESHCGSLLGICFAFVSEQLIVRRIATSEIRLQRSGREAAVRCGAQRACPIGERGDRARSTTEPAKLLPTRLEPPEDSPDALATLWADEVSQARRPPATEWPPRSGRH